MDFDFLDSPKGDEGELMGKVINFGAIEIL
jgi:hypothetical protein